MLRRLTIVAALAAGMCITAVMTLATPALAKGPTQARITGPGLAGHGIVVSGNGEPGQLSRLARLATQTSLFTVLFGPGGNIPVPPRPRTAPSAASVGPQYTVVYTVPRVTPRGYMKFGRIRQDLYPLAAGGPLIYIPPGQIGFGQPIRITGWIRASTRLTRTLNKLGVPLRQEQLRKEQRRDTRAANAQAAAAHNAGATTSDWLIGAAVAIAAAALAGAAWRVRHRRPAAGRAGGAA